MTMMMYDMGRQYHAERVMSAGERRRADEQAGRMAAEASGCGSGTSPGPPGRCAPCGCPVSQSAGDRIR